MTERFEIGEVAIFCKPDHAELNSAYVGQECTVNSALGWRFPRCSATGKLIEVYGYQVIAQDGHVFSCRPDQLKKRRPPQDWQQLCNLQDKPIEAPTRELEIA